jgi:hypothetical protein
VVCSEKIDDFYLRALKSGLYDASHHKANNCLQKFCKFCARELEMIGFIFL